MIEMINRKQTKRNLSKSKKTKPTKTKTKKPVSEIEFEGRILNINPEELRAKIKSLGGVLKSRNTLYRRSVFNLCDIKRGFVRVRDEGDKTTLTAKIYKNPDFPEEYELTLKEPNSFEHGQEFLRALNLTEKAYHETMREKWSIFRKGSGKGSKKELCEVAIDHIPGLPVYAELECKSEADLRLVCKMLEIEYKDLAFGGYGKVYVEYYGMSENEINNIVPKLTFQNIKSEIGSYVHKNHDILDKATKDNLAIYRKL